MGLRLKVLSLAEQIPVNTPHYNQSCVTTFFFNANGHLHRLYFETLRSRKKFTCEWLAAVTPPAELILFHNTKLAAGRQLLGMLEEILGSSGKQIFSFDELARFRDNWLTTDAEERHIPQELCAFMKANTVQIKAASMAERLRALNFS